MSWSPEFRAAVSLLQGSAKVDPASVLIGRRTLAALRRRLRDRAYHPYNHHQRWLVVAPRYPDEAAGDGDGLALVPAAPLAWGINGAVIDAVGANARARGRWFLPTSPKKCRDAWIMGLRARAALRVRGRKLWGWGLRLPRLRRTPPAGA